MVKSYLRYAAEDPFGLISTSTGNLCFDSSGKYAICPALQDCLVWHIKQGELVGRWSDPDNKSSEVTFITRAPGQDLFAVGYGNGYVRIWDLKTGGCVCTLNGHKSAISALAFDRSGTRLISGSRDTDIVLWDLVAESGLYRLKGHKDQITWLEFVYPNNAENEDKVAPSFIISTSKDTLVKVWSLASQHCVETLIGHRSEIWSAVFSNDHFITGSSDSDIRIYHFSYAALLAKSTSLKASNETGDEDKDDNNEAFKLLGVLQRSSKERVSMIRIDPNGRYLAVQTADKTMEFFQIKTEQELLKTIKKRAKRKQKSTDDQMQVDETPLSMETLPMEDRYVSVRVYKSTAKIRSFDFSPIKCAEECMNVLVGYSNNMLQYLQVKPGAEVNVLSGVEIPGHRNDIRTTCLSSDDTILLSASSQSSKLWNVESRKCIRSLPIDKELPICSLFLPGNRHVIIGTKSGKMELYDTWSCVLLESITAHNGAVWTIDIHPDKQFVVTGGADKEVKFWEFNAIDDPEYSKTNRRLTLVHVKTLQMPDEVLCVRFTPNGKLIACSLLDSTVKVFFADSLKFFLSLYGHKLPVLTMDISSDNNLLITGSADKSIKIWGLDFGDCHRSLLAHDNSVMQVRFVQNTHYFFSCSKDNSIKYWDGDRFEMIQKLEGHTGEVWTMCLSKWANFVVTSGHDKSIRMWRKTDEQLFLEEEREKEIEERYEQEYVDGQAADGSNEGNEVTIAAKNTIESLKYGEKLIELLELVENEWSCDGQTQSQNPILVANGGISCEAYALKIFEQIKSSEMHQSLWILSYSKIETLLRLVNFWLERGVAVELSTKIINSVLRIHHNQLAQSYLGPLLSAVYENLSREIKNERDMMAFNIHSLRLIKRLHQASEITIE